MTDSAHAEPEPIDAEYEPAENAPAKPQRRAAPPRMRSRTVTLPQLLTASGIAAILGATVAIIVNNASSGAPTGTLAREIDGLTQKLDALEVRAQQGGADIVSLRARLDANSDRLNRRDTAERDLRTDFAALASQVSAISGAGDGASPPGAAANATPLGILLARINKLERIVADATSAPETTREVQRAVADLSLQVAELNLANTTLVSAFDRREAALAALESGMRDLASRATPTPAGAPRIAVAAAEGPLAPSLPVHDAVARAQTIRSLSVLESAARTDNAFAREHRALADALPGDQELAALARFAASGVPTLASLRAEFDASAARGQRHAAEDSDDGWNWLRQAFAGVVAFEPDRQVSLNAETLRTARRQLDVGEIRDAVTAISGLPGRASQDFAVWREKALQRAELDDALTALNTRLLGAAAAPGPGQAASQEAGPPPG